MSTEQTRELATLAGGCFWCLEAVYKGLRGVERVVSGYAGGHVLNPTYRQVCDGTTGHAEVVQITFDPHVVSYKELLEVFFTIHDPTTLNRQGADVGTQYRSAIFTSEPAEIEAARAKIADLTEGRKFAVPIVTTIEPATAFYPAEDYHQDFASQNPNHPYIRGVSYPKVCKVRDRHSDLIG